VWTVAVSGKKKLRIQKYPDTCGRGLIRLKNKIKCSIRVRAHHYFISFRSFFLFYCLQMLTALLTAFAMLHLTLPSFKGLKRYIHHFYPPSVSKKMSGLNKKFPSSKHNVMVSFKMMYDDFYFSALTTGIRTWRFFSVTTTNLQTYCKNSKNNISSTDS